MSRGFKPLDRDRKTGIVLIPLTIASFTLAYNTHGSLQFSFMVMGMCFFMWLLALMGKSVDEAGGFGADESEGQAFPSPDDGLSEEDRRLYIQDRYQFKPLDRERKLGIVFILLTIAAFTVGANTVGWVQVVSMVVGLLSFLTIFVLMGKSIDKQNEEIRRRKRGENPDGDQPKE